ncbi:hypothetical protein [Streptomyces lydicus]|uniref:hypothetical protein n=1 Tax=Streptomyces lydicus TaxID=47763 RepID=UPI0037BA1FAD
MDGSPVRPDEAKPFMSAEFAVLWGALSVPFGSEPDGKDKAERQDLDDCIVDG